MYLADVSVTLRSEASDGMQGPSCIGHDLLREVDSQCPNALCQGPWYNSDHTADPTYKCVTYATPRGGADSWATLMLCPTTTSVCTFIRLFAASLGVEGMLT